MLPRISKELISGALTMLLVMTLASCSSFPKIGNDDLMNKIQFGTDVVFLNAEFENARDTLLLNDLNDEERAAVNRGIAQLQRVKDALENLGEGGEATAISVLSLSQGGELLSQIGGAYSTIKFAYMSFLKRNNYVPDQQIVLYDQIALRAFSVMSQQLIKDESVPSADIGNMLSSIARTFLIYKGVPITGTI